MPLVLSRDKAKANVYQSLKAQTAFFTKFASVQKGSEFPKNAQKGQKHKFIQATKRHL